MRHDTSESMCNTNDFYVETDNERRSEGNPEHTLREEKPINDLDKLDEIIKNPDRILDYNERRYILKKFEDGVALIVMGENKKYGAKTVYELITQLTDDNELFESEDDAFDEVDDEQEEETDITEDIEC